MRLLDVILQFVHRSRRRVRRAAFSTTNALTIWPRSVVGDADHATFGHGRMREQRAFHFRARDVVAGADDHVVGARLIDELAVGVDEIRVARVVPAVLHILALAVVGR